MANCILLYITKHGTRKSGHIRICMLYYILYKIRDADFECNIRSITFIVYLPNLPLQISMTLSTLCSVKFRTLYA